MHQNSFYSKTSFKMRLGFAALIVMSAWGIALSFGGQTQTVRVIKELDDDHILIQTKEKGFMLLEKWNLRLSPLVFEGKAFLAEISSLWVTIYIDDREPIKWSVKDSYENYSYYEDTSIDGTVTTVSKGTIFRTSSGNIYEVTAYGYSYSYEYRPDTIVLKAEDADIYVLLVDGVDEPVRCRSLSGPQRNEGKQGGLIRSYITNKFDGLNMGNIYVLANGQVWEQIEAYIWIWIWISPPVIIWESNGVFQMKVDLDGIPKAVMVRRIK